MMSKLNYKSHQILGLQSILQYPIISFLKTQLQREIFPDQNKSKTIHVMFKCLTGLLLLFITDLFYLSDVTFMWVMFQKQFSIGLNFLHLRAFPVQHSFSFGIIFIICLSFHFGTIWNNGTDISFSVSGSGEVPDYVSFLRLVNILSWIETNFQAR